MKRVIFELDATPNTATRIFFEIYRFVSVPINLFKHYFKKFKIKKISRFYKFVNFPLSNLIFKYVIIGVIFAYIVATGLFAIEFDDGSIIKYTGLSTLVVFFPYVIKLTFLILVQTFELLYKIVKTVLYTLATLFTESMH